MFSSTSQPHDFGVFHAYINGHCKHECMVLPKTFNIFFEFSVFFVSMVFPKIFRAQMLKIWASRTMLMRRFVSSFRVDTFTWHRTVPKQLDENFGCLKNNVGDIMINGCNYIYIWVRVKNRIWIAPR